MLAPRLDNQHQRGNVPRSVVRLRDAHRLDVHHERRHHGRAAEHHRPTDSDRARGRQRVAHQPFETDLVGRRAGAQHPVPVQQPIAAPQDAPGAVVPLQDPPAPVQVEDADPRVVEQGGHGRGARLGADQRLPDTDELSEPGIHLTQVTPTSCSWAHSVLASQSATIERYGVGSTAMACCTRR